MQLEGKYPGVLKPHIATDFDFRSIKEKHFL